MSQRNLQSTYSLRRKLWVDWMDGMGWSPGGVKYKAVYAANNNNTSKKWVYLSYCASER